MVAHFFPTSFRTSYLPGILWGLTTNERYCCTTLSMSQISIGVPSIASVGKGEAGADAARAETFAGEE